METSNEAKKIHSILDESDGLEFEKAVAEAFSFLDFEAGVLEETEAESDVIVEARLARHPYFVIVECCAVREGNQVPYTKLGQIRGNYVKYATGKDYVSFETTYLAIVGRPSFSRNAIRLSNSVTLLTVEGLKSLVSLHDTYCFTQDELEEVFNPEGGPVTEFSSLEEAGMERRKRIDLYALIYATLTSHIGMKLYGRTWVSREVLVGSVRYVGGIFRSPHWAEEEVTGAIWDMASPLVRILEIDQETEYVRPTSLPFDRIVQNMGQNGQQFSQLVLGHQRRLDLLSSRIRIAQIMGSRTS